MCESRPKSDHPEGLFTEESRFFRNCFETKNALKCYHTVLYTSMN